MSFEVVSEEGWPDYEIWTCDKCHHQIALAGVGGDVAECPVCIAKENGDEHADEAEHLCPKCGEEACPGDCQLASGIQEDGNE